MIIWDLYNRIYNDIMCIPQGYIGDLVGFTAALTIKVFQQPNMGIQPSTIGISP